MPPLSPPASPTALTQSPAWKALRDHHGRTAGQHMRDLFAADPGRAQRFGLEAAGLHLDYSKQRITAETLPLLLGLAAQQQIPDRIRQMFAGDDINFTEHRPALHVALRAETGVPFLDEVRAVRQSMYALAESLRSGSVPGTSGTKGGTTGGTVHVINLGIGGSDLGPRLAAGALTRYTGPSLKAHFVTNVDPSDLDETLAGIAPENAFFIVTSKSFTTVETLSNAERARDWLKSRLGARFDPARHFAAVTSAPDAARAWGIPEAHVLPMWDWVGGRYSLWSAVGLAVAAAVGPQHFDELLAGARAMDEHFRSAPLERNMPVIMAALSLWNSVFHGAETQVVLPYCHELRDLPSYLQQLQMESNGKRVNKAGQPVDYPTSPVFWGSAGTVGQHSFHQLLHQGTHLIPADFIVPVNGPGDKEARHMLVANALAQASTLAVGADNADPHRVHPGNQPSNTILFDRLTPQSLGALIALYEHKVYAESILLDINAFDQWGVELGKKVAREIQSGAGSNLDASTLELMRRADALRKTS
ncbi:MAG TPA: glucose-6-phosphate isomerase [Burkholderiales bacterium]|nr:glucose-6-phosphate isomerase [Burkholderiales bacterium]